MSITVQFVADFEAFTKAIERAERRLRELEKRHAARAAQHPVGLAIPLAMTAAALVASPKRFSRRSLLGLNWGGR